jgi:hypothetical protein
MNVARIYRPVLSILLAVALVWVLSTVSARASDDTSTVVTPYNLAGSWNVRIAFANGLTLFATGPLNQIGTSVTGQWSDNRGCTFAITGRVSGQYLFARSTTLSPCVGSGSFVARFDSSGLSLRGMYVSPDLGSGSLDGLKSSTLQE